MTVSQCSRSISRKCAVGLAQAALLTRTSTPPNSLCRLVEESGDVFGAADVGGHGDGLVAPLAQLVGDGLDGLGLATVDDDAHAFGGEAIGDAAADAAARAGDDGDFVREVVRHGRQLGVRRPAYQLARVCFALSGARASESARSRRGPSGRCRTTSGHRARVWRPARRRGWASRPCSPASSLLRRRSRHCSVVAC